MASRLDERPPFWRNVRVLAWVAQLAVLAAVFALLAWLYLNFRQNSEDQGIPTGFGYLDQPAGFPIAGNPFRTSQSVWDATVVGIRNTLYVVVAGIVLATVLGVLVGVARLSGNWLLSRAAALYVEALRNTPLLAIVAFMYLALVINAFPQIQDAWDLSPITVISNRAAAVPWFEGSAWWVVGAGLAGVVAAAAVALWRRSVSDRTGAPARSGLWSLGAFVVAAAVVWIVGGMGITTPSFEDRKISGGMGISPEYLALLLALVLYTASHIAEIVRGSIQAVAIGQGEAASALALSGRQRMWYVVLPQAMRIAIPPIGNQYLNLFKNSSLGFAISYFELTKVTNTAVGNGHPAVPAFTLLMALYLAGSLTLSLGVNVANRRLAVVER